MTLEIGLWRVDGEPSKITAASMPLERRLEDLIESDPTILGEPIMLIGRQVPTAFGKYIDLLGIDSDGQLHILELKRDRTPRDVVAQTLDYGSWAQELTNDEVRDIYAVWQPKEVFDEQFANHFGTAPPDDLNSAHSLTVVASEVDPSTERIITYLNATYGVPINVVLFRYFEDEGRSYLARTWLLSEAQTSSTSASKKSRGRKEEWNGQDWYVSFGDESGSRSWEDGRKYGFVSAGGGAWFTRTLRGLPIGARVFVNIPKTGYVGVGTVTGPATQFKDATIETADGPRRLSDLSLIGQYTHEPENDQDAAEYVVPVEWISTVDKGDGVWNTGMFANQNSACKLRSHFTIDELVRAFQIDD